MIPELGNFSLIIALAFALLQSLSIGFNDKALAQRIAIAATLGQFIFITLSFMALMTSFALNDLTVLFVREHSHALLPFIYKLGASWGGHEGSLVLWCFVLSGWSVLFTLNFLGEKKSLPHFNSILHMLGFISFGFILFLLLTSNPFARLFPLNPIQGDDLTPLLQDPGLIFHPPMLYFGYVGFAIPFAYALSALLKGELSMRSIASLRPWVILPWSFLSCGIVLGSWWAYRELGWGGWWFWDPVENASLLPWLAATALLHTLVVGEKRGSFKGWIILLAILTFSLSLIGTFLVRSGVLVSVHAFASDPTRGLFLLAYLSLLIGGGFSLYACRIHLFYKAPSFNFISRETTLLLNSVILITAVVTITLGTLYPIILDALDLGKISVGEPYFNIVFIPLMLPMLLLMALAPHLKWQADTLKNVISHLGVSLFFSSVTAAGILYFAFHFTPLSFIALFASFLLLFSTLQLAFERALNLRHTSMILAHIGIAIIAIGITINKNFSAERQVKISPSEVVHIAGFSLKFENLTQVQAGNYTSQQANFSLVDQPSIKISAEQRTYLSHQQTLSHPGISSNAFRDLYIALGNPLDKNAWSVRIYYKPFVRWIWTGGFLLLLGGLLSFLDYLLKRKTHA